MSRPQATAPRERLVPHRLADARAEECYIASVMSLEEQRRRAQLAFVVSEQELEIGEASRLPRPLADLATLPADSPLVEQVFAGGLTAVVYKLCIDGRRWALKRQRPQSLVQNVDGQTSFLNEVQRRKELQELQALAPSAAPLREHLVQTHYASLRHGLLLSPWVEGAPLQRFDGRVFDQLFATLVELELAGFFEWDLSPGNLLDDGERVTLFDFGYMYRFDPLAHYNSNGLDTPLFHGIERFETRCFFGFLLQNPLALEQAGLLALFREEKELALSHYQHKLSRLERARAAPAVLRWQRAILQRWSTALASPRGLDELYLLESFRSHVLDLLDDLHGKSCTPHTLNKAAAVSQLLREHHSLLAERGGLFFGDEALSRAELLAKYHQLERQAAEHLLP